ncbi:MAG: restriction endonuclease [Gaiellaceae bacterium]
MALWVVRTGKQGQFLSKFLSDSRIYLTWTGLNVDISAIPTKSELSELMALKYPSASAVLIANHTGQIWRFANEMKPGDWVVVPDKASRAINVGEITGDYVFVPDGPDPFFHYRDVKWIANDVPRTNFPKDILFSLGGLLTIFSVTRHNAEARVRAMAENGWRAEEITPLRKATSGAEGTVDDGEAAPDLEQLAGDEIAKLITARFKGHDLARLVEGVLKVRGYTTFRSPEGTDKGVDILAGSDSLGFGDRKLCVQVKSGDSPLDRPTLDQLIGTMENVRAQQGLLVSWGGFKQSVKREEPNQFFRVRLWDQQRLIEEILDCYAELDEDLRAELPLKQIWMLARDTEETVADEESAG